MKYSVIYLFFSRLRLILKQLDGGQVTTEILQRNLQYAVQVLEALYTEEPRYVTTCSNCPVKNELWYTLSLNWDHLLINAHSRHFLLKLMLGSSS